MEKLPEVKCLSELLHLHTQCEIKSDEDVKSERKILKDVRDLYIQLIGKITAQTTSLKRMFQKKQKSIKDDADKKTKQVVKEEEQTRKRLAAENVVAAGQKSAKRQQV